MKRFVRIYGLVAFVVVTAAIACVYFFLADWLLKRTVEKAGTRAAGARVELKDADLTLLPLGITLTGLEVTDRDATMRNLIQINRIAFLMDGGMALRRKVIIKEMAVEGIAFGTPRTYSGALPKKVRREKDAEEEKAPPSGPPMFSLDVPDIDDILKKEELNTLKVARELETDIKGKRDEWEKRISNLPDADDIKKYEARSKRALEGKKTPSDIAKSVVELKAVRDEIDRDIKNIKTASRDLNAELSAVELKLKELKNAPQKDVDRLARKYSLTPEGLGNMSAYFFGDRIQKYVRQARKYHQMAAPYIKEYRERKPEKPKHPRGKGIDVRFREYNPRPDFLIERTAATATLSYGDIEGVITDITTEQGITGRPTDFKFEGTKLKGLDSLTLTGSLDHRKPEAARDSFNITASGLDVDRVKLSSSPDFPVRLSRAELDIETDGVLSDGMIDATIRAGFSSVRMDAGKNGSGVIAKTIASALEGVREFSLSARVTGNPESPKIDISSDLDDVLRQAADRAVRDQANQFRRDLEKEVRAKTGARIRELESSTGSLSNLRGRLQNSEKGLNAALDETKKEPVKLIQPPVKTPSPLKEPLKDPAKSLDKLKKLF
jgi:uncharacterized protein (TIGR03545 family)